MPELRLRFCYAGSARFGPTFDDAMNSIFETGRPDAAETRTFEETA